MAASGRYQTITPGNDEREWNERVISDPRYFQSLVRRELAAHLRQQLLMAQLDPWLIEQERHWPLPPEGSWLAWKYDNQEEWERSENDYDVHEGDTDSEMPDLIDNSDAEELLDLRNIREIHDLWRDMNEKPWAMLMELWNTCRLTGESMRPLGEWINRRLNRYPPGHAKALLRDDELFIKFAGAEVIRYKEETPRTTTIHLFTGTWVKKYLGKALSTKTRNTQFRISNHRMRTRYPSEAMVNREVERGNSQFTNSQFTSRISTPMYTRSPTWVEDRDAEIVCQCNECAEQYNYYGISYGKTLRCAKIDKCYWCWKWSMHLYSTSERDFPPYDSSVYKEALCLQCTISKYSLGFGPPWTPTKQTRTDTKLKEMAKHKGIPEVVMTKIISCLCTWLDP